MRTIGFSNACASDGGGGTQRTLQTLRMLDIQSRRCINMVCWQNAMNLMLCRRDMLASVRLIEITQIRRGKERVKSFCWHTWFWSHSAQPGFIDAVVAPKMRRDVVIDIIVLLLYSLVNFGWVTAGSMLCIEYYCTFVFTTCALSLHQYTNTEYCRRARRFLHAHNPVS